MRLASNGFRGEGGKGGAGAEVAAPREKDFYLLTALSSISCWAFFCAASIVELPNSLRKTKDMDDTKRRNEGQKEGSFNS
jgi:hypothetical protein